jgi:hypothetical protein
MNLLLFSAVQALGRHWEWAADNAADTGLGTRLGQDATRFIAYGVDHLRALTRVRPHERENLNGHLDLVEEGLVGWLGARACLEPLVLLSGGFAPVRALYESLACDYFERCEAAGLGDRRQRSPLTRFLAMLRD